MNKAKLYLAFVMLSLAALSATALMANEPVTVTGGVYSASQAARGEPLFEANCAECHDVEFYKNSLNNRANQPVAYMFEQMLFTMPLTAPGLLQEQEYEDVFAYILQLAGFPAGDSDLTYASGDMNTILVQTPD